MRRSLMVLAAGTVLLVVGAGPALACGGLVGRNGAVNLLRTSTLAAYHGGVEHYVTSFEFAGGGGAFGSIVPLPDVPTKVERGGDWTLQRLVRETQPQPSDTARLLASEAGAAGPAEVLMETRVDALDLTVLKGGGASVGEWAAKNGFDLPPDAPEVLDFYANRSPIFLAARFDADAAAARGQELGDGTPIHLTIPTTNPWVPLRILGLGRRGIEQVQADVYLLTGRRPRLLSGDEGAGLTTRHQQPASDRLLTDLRSDKGMEWVPASAWLTQLRLDTPAADLDYDLAVDADGLDQPSREAAGLRADPPVVARSEGRVAPAVLLALGTAALAGMAALALVLRRQPPAPTVRT
jgi:hypothetical protein